MDERKIRAARKVQFSVENVGFFKDNKILPRGSNPDILLTVDSCTMKIIDQKNGQMGERNCIAQKRACKMSQSHI